MFIFLSVGGCDMMCVSDVLLYVWLLVDRIDFECLGFGVVVEGS